MEAEAGAPQRLNVAEHFLDRHLRHGRGQRVAIAGVGPPVTYAELAQRANRVGAVWRELGVQPARAGRPGDRVLLVLPDSPEFIACFFGTVKIGAVAVPVNPFARTADYAYYAADCQPRLAVVHATSFAEALPALTQLQPPPRLLTVGGRAPDSDSLEEMLGRSPDKLEAHPTAAADVAFFLYTSGSGGEPKAAIHRHRHMLTTAEGFARQVLGIRPDDVTFSASKLFFAYGLGNGMYFPLSVGAATVLLPERPTPENLFAVLERHRPSLFFAVPTIYGALLRAAEGDSRRLDSVRAAVSAGEALPVEIFQRFRQRYGQEILDGIGTTEMLHMFISNRPGEVRPGSCGREVPGYRARIVTESGDEAGAGEIGNLWVQGGSAFAGYWNKPDLTARTKRGEWVVTGDKFFRDSDGYYHYCGRSDDMLKVAGWWVSPLEVENALLAHPAVAEAAVVGQRDADGLTRVVAYVVLREPGRPAQVRWTKAGQGRGKLAPTASPGDQTTSALAAELPAFVRQRLPGYKCPQRIEFVTELPKTATGKIQRFKLRS